MIRNLLKTSFAGVLILLAGAAASLQAQQQPVSVPLPRIAAPLAETAVVRAPEQVRVLPKDTQKLQEWLQEKLPQVQVKRGTSQTVALSNLKPGDLARLLQCPWVRYIDRGHRQAKEELELKDSDLSANSITAVHAKYPELNGTGILISVKENPFDTTDIDLKGRIVPSPASDEFPSTHATTMATIIAGGGNSTPQALGVAWGSSVISSSFANLMPDETTALEAQRVSVQSHSYGVGVENYYGLESMAYDEQALAYPNLLHVFSSGNSGTATPETGTYAGMTGVANLTGQFKTSKNSLIVGALDASRTVGVLSSTGPAYDGRVKPELVAHGVGGTSEAAAVAAGVAALVQQAYAAQKNGDLPPAALVKAVMINSADDVGNPHVDYKSGYGNVDALGAVETVRMGHYFTGSIRASTTDKFVLQVPEGVEQLKITLVWHDAASLPDAPTALINDLDLRLQHIGSQQAWQPWVLNPYPHPDSLNKTATRRADHLNNAEQVTLQQPPSGTYEIQIEGFDVPQGPQPYSIAYEYASGLAWTYPSQHSSLEANNTARIRWSGNDSGSAQLEYQLNGQNAWILLSDDVDLSQPYFDWNTPDTLALAQLRLVTQTQTVLSPEFMLAPVARPAITLHCDGQVLLQWAPKKGVKEYQVYSLQGLYTQPLQTVTDTVVLLSATAQEAPYLAVAPVLGGMAGKRSQTVAYDPQAEMCHIYSFLPEQLVMDSVLFALYLNTGYNLQEVALERLEQGSYTLIETKPASHQTSFVLHDPHPQAGLNRYRARVTNLQGQHYYSQAEDAFFTQPDFIQAGPNPVVAGQEVEVVAYGNGIAWLQLYNTLGQLVYTAADGGVLKTVPTAGLPAGIYILRMQTAQGQQLSTRLLVQ